MSIKFKNFYNIYAFDSGTEREVLVEEDVWFQNLGFEVTNLIGKTLNDLEAGKPYFYNFRVEAVA